MSVPVSIVIPVHNGRALLENLLESIGRQTVAPLEIIVVDNGSTDGAPESAGRRGARVVAMGGNTGFAAAVNRGIQEARGECIAVINSDVVLESGWLEILWQGASSSGSGFATGKILQAGNNAILDGAYDLICRGGCSWRAGAGMPVSALPDTPRSIRFCSATAALYRAGLLRNAGGFEELFESYLEDVDLGLRCASAGEKGDYFPAAVCRHVGSATFGRWNPKIVRLIARNQVFLIARHYPWELIRRWAWPIAAAHTLWGALAFRHGCGIAWLRGKFEGVRRFSAVRRTASPSTQLASVIVESERQLYRIQSGTGFDTFWKFYFRMVGVPK